MEPLPRPTDGDRNRGPQLLAMWWTELSICIIMVILRFYSRYKLKNFGTDDWLMLTALVSSTIDSPQSTTAKVHPSDPVHIHDNMRNIRRNRRRRATSLLPEAGGYPKGHQDHLDRESVGYHGSSDSENVRRLPDPAAHRAIDQMAQMVSVHEHCPYIHNWSSGLHLNVCAMQPTARFVGADRGPRRQMLETECSK